MNNATFSPVSAFGQPRCAPQDGRTTDPSLQALAPASLSASEAIEKGLTTNVTSGPLSAGSFKTRSLRLCLANKLQARLEGLGSSMYQPTWKLLTMPSGMQFFRLAASARRSCESGFTGWPTPQARDYKDKAAPSVRSSGRSDKLPHAVHLLNLGINRFGFHAPTGEFVQLNPGFARWLMGIPPIWDQVFPRD